MRRQTCLLLLFAPLLAFQAFGRTRLEEYALILQDPPLARQMAARARVEAAQQRLRGELARRKIKVGGSAETLVNAVFVRAPRERVAELRSLDGVRHVVGLPRIKRNLNVAVNLVNLPAAWSALSGGMANAGAGVKIAIIDSGIDNTHPAFQDSSAPPSGYPLGDTAYTNGKIIVARSYEPMFFLPDDTTPRDRSGHGTALAMIAAGQTNTGPLATITGVAPKAWLGNYKIFGTPGLNDTAPYAAVIQAVEDAVADHMDIALVAFGSLPLTGPLIADPTCATTGVPSAYQDNCDIPAQAVENAVSMGMTVVVAAGNDAQSSQQAAGPEFHRFAGHRTLGHHCWRFHQRTYSFRLGDHRRFERALVPANAGRSRRGWRETGGSPEGPSARRFLGGPHWAGLFRSAGQLARGRNRADRAGQLRLLH